MRTFTQIPFFSYVCLLLSFIVLEAFNKSKVGRSLLAVDVNLEMERQGCEIV